MLETDRAEADMKELLSRRERQLHSVSYSVPQIREPHEEKLFPLLMGYYRKPANQPKQKKTRVPAMGRMLGLGSQSEI